MQDVLTGGVKPVQAGFSSSGPDTVTGAFEMHSIGAAASLSCVQIETIRYYERSGVVPRPARTSSGRRTYDAEDIARLRFVKRCRTLGFSLTDIQIQLRIADENRIPCPEASTIGERRLSEIRQKIEALRGQEWLLATLLDKCAGEQCECPMLNGLMHGLELQGLQD